MIRVFSQAVFIVILTISAVFSQGSDIPGAASTMPEAVKGDSEYEIGGKAEYFFGSKDGGALMIKVNLWGKVLRPGLYEIPINTDLVTLMSFAGGPEESARLDNIRIIRHTSGETIVMNVDVKKYLSTGDQELIPILMPSDTILISGSTLHLFALTVKVLGQIMTAVNFYFFLTGIL